MSEQFIAKLYRNGDQKHPSCVLTVPHQLVQFLKLKAGDAVRVTVEKA